MAGRKHPPKVYAGGLTGRFYCATRYTFKPDAPGAKVGTFNAIDKYDVTDDVLIAIANVLDGRTGGKGVIVLPDGRELRAIEPEAAGPRR